MTTNIQLEDFARRNKFHNFRGVVFVDQLCSMRPKKIECGILGSKNSRSNDDMHWTCWYKFKNRLYAFDSFGLPPDQRLVAYLKSSCYPLCHKKKNNILYSSFKLQNFGDNDCGDWCLYMLNNLNYALRKNGKITNADYEKVILHKVTDSTF